MKIPKWNDKSGLILLILFLLIFPKGGIKINHIPLTWGYLLLGLTAIVIALQKKWIISRSHLLVLTAQIPFQLISLITLFLNGIEHVGSTLAFAIHFFLFPPLFFGLLSKSIQTLDLDFFISFFKKGVLFISYFGIFLFFFTMLTGKFLLIPLLTANLHDMDSIELTKCILRGDLFKLISTYNNGNIYGICLLMLLPLYQSMEESRWKRAIVKLSLLLTLSRTVWIGLLAEEFLRQLYVNELNRKTFVKLCSRWFVAIFIITLALYRLDRDLSFILDPTLGGRSEQFTILSEMRWISDIPFVGFAEIVYLNVLKSFGIFGLLTFLIAMTAPLWIYVFFSKTQTSSFQRSIISGLCLYLFISFSDGAILFIPVMAFYWFLSSLLLRGRATSCREFSDLRFEGPVARCG